MTETAPPPNPETQPEQNWLQDLDVYLQAAEEHDAAGRAIPEGDTDFLVDLASRVTARRVVTAPGKSWGGVEIPEEAETHYDITSRLPDGTEVTDTMNPDLAKRLLSYAKAHKPKPKPETDATKTDNSGTAAGTAENNTAAKDPAAKVDDPNKDPATTRAASKPADNGEDRKNKRENKRKTPDEILDDYLTNYGIERAAWDEIGDDYRRDVISWMHRFKDNPDSVKFVVDYLNDPDKRAFEMQRRETLAKARAEEAHRNRPRGIEAAKGFKWNISSEANARDLRASEALRYKNPGDPYSGRLSEHDYYQRLHNEIRDFDTKNGYEPSVPVIEDLKRRSAKEVWTSATRRPRKVGGIALRGVGLTVAGAAGMALIGGEAVVKAPVKAAKKAGELNDKRKENAAKRKEKEKAAYDAAWESAAEKAREQMVAEMARQLKENEANGTKGRFAVDSSGRTTYEA